VSGRKVSRNRYVAGTESLAVMKCAHVLDGRDWLQGTALRIALTNSSFPQHFRAPFAGHHASAAASLQLGYAAGVIGMHVRIHD
jgi:hypothetical protein